VWFGKYLCRSFPERENPKNQSHRNSSEMTQKPDEPDSRLRGNDELEVTRNPKKAKSNPTDRVFVCTEIMQ
ncbi:TPA: hypothetical protein ACKUHF_002060, partial [Neisseria gonorrhoeae]